MVFAMYRYYPSGGANDLVACCSELDEAIERAKLEVNKECGPEYWHIYCTETFEIVKEGSLK